jgi:hypothetical protein
MVASRVDGGTIMTAPTTASLSTVSLRRIVAGLDRGDRVRVTFTDGHVEVGTLRKSGLSVLEPERPGVGNLLYLASDSRAMIRDVRGLPALGVAAVEPWDDNARFDLLMDHAQNYLALEHDAQTAPQSERDWRQEMADQAKDAFIEEWIVGEVR